MGVGSQNQSTIDQKTTSTSKGILASIFPSIWEDFGTHVGTKNQPKTVPRRYQHDRVTRFSKYVIIELLNKFYCIIHLGMSGTIHIAKKINNKNLVTNSSFYHSPYLPEKHNHVEFVFRNFRLIYNDPRRFGYFKIFTSKNKLKNFIFKYGL